MPLHPEARKVLRLYSTFGTSSPEKLPIWLARSIVTSLGPLIPRERIAWTKNLTISGADGPLRVRVLRSAVSGPLPIVLCVHGGGWVLGGPSVAERSARYMANHVPCVAVTLDYRHAPEHRFPAAVLDVFAVLNWVALHGGAFGGDPSRIALVGDSTGGNLVAAVCLLARDERGPQIAGQVLVQPMVDFDFDTPSYREYGYGYCVGFTRDTLMWFADQYLRSPSDRMHPYAAPLRASAHHGLPPALILTSECDPYRDEGEAFAQKLHDSGVPTTLFRYDGLIHGLFSLSPVLSAGRNALHRVASTLSNWLTRPSEESPPERSKILTTHIGSAMLGDNQFINSQEFD